jgi:hypothetical protein
MNLVARRVRSYSSAFDIHPPRIGETAGTQPRCWLTKHSGRSRVSTPSGEAPRVSNARSRERATRARRLAGTLDRCDSEG